MSLGMPTPRDLRPTERYLPVAYFAAVIAFVAFLLPTTLRTPPQQPPTSAELNPDLPPDESLESILSELGGARSRTAGAGPAVGPAEEPELADSAQAPRRSCRYGVGDPPRQTESLYAAPCAPAWMETDNGGATWTNVFPDEIRLGVSHVLGNASEGLIRDEPPPREGSEHRTLRVLQAYFNQAYELYGRRLQIVQLAASSADAVTNTTHAVRAAEEHKVFGSYYLYSGFCEEMARRQLITVCNPMTEEFHERHAPYVYAWMMNLSKVDRMGAEYICKKLEGKPAEFAGTGVQGTPRRFGAIYETGEARNGGRTHRYFTGQLRDQCGVEAAQAIDIATAENDASGQMAATITRMRAEGVTSIVLQTEYVSAVQLMAAADAQGYYPEWLIFFPYGLDINFIGAILPQAQMAHAFGLSAWEMPAGLGEGDCERAYRTIDPESSPNGTTCGNFFNPLQQMLNGIQLAGPNLTPITFRDGLFRQGHRFYPEPWAIGGGYGPGDWTYMDNMGEIWWDASAPRPPDGSPGAYRWVRDGQRYREGEQPVEDPLVFKDGISTRPRPEEGR